MYIYTIETNKHKNYQVMKAAIGQLKTKVTKYCTVCGCSTKRSLVVLVYENTPEKIEAAKQEIKDKASKEYTCRICKSIEKDLRN